MGCEKPTTLNIIQRFKSKVLKSVMATSWYLSSQILHDYEKIPLMKDEIHQATTSCNENIILNETDNKLAIY